MLKTMTIVGTRPELIKMSRVIAAMDQYTEHVLVHSGQNYDYELNQVFFDDLEIRKPDHFLNGQGESPMEMIGEILVKADAVLEAEAPDAVLLYGDTNSCLSVIAAKRRKIPVFHMEAGNRCFDQRVPEELNRKVVDHLSDINLVLSEHARRYLIAENVRPETIIKTGSHMPEVLAHYREKIGSSDALERLELKQGDYFLVSMHREENVDRPETLQQLLDSINGLVENYDLPVIVSTHPRTRRRMDDLDNVTLSDRIQFMKPFGFCDYIRLQMGASCVVSDSGTITEEASFLNIPAITIRTAHERPEGMDAGTLIMSGLRRKRVLEAVEIIRNQRQTGTFYSAGIEDYGSLEKPNLVSQQVLRIVQSYTDYINRTVWRKEST